MTENYNEVSRANEYKKKATNPCKKFYTWSSNYKCFTYYDREEKANIKVDLHIRFITLKQLSTVKGWDNDSASGIYSNEVENLFTDVLNVRAFKGGDIAQGIYSDIRTAVIEKGGHYEKSIYCIDGTGEMINIAFKGSGVSSWSDFLNAQGADRLLNEWVIVDEAIAKKNGAVSYSIPAFSFLKELSTDEIGEADTKYKTLMEYFNAYKVQPKDKEKEEDKVDD